MSGNWDFYPLWVDDEPASIYVDLALARVAPVRAEPNVAYIRVRMRQPRPDGLSSDEEFPMLLELEDLLVGDIARKDTATYAGRKTSGGTRDFYFYTADPTTFAQSAKRAMARKPEYQFEIGSRLDPSWSVYFEFLYPPADDLQRMLNRRANDSLAAHRVELSKPRAIVHRACLPSLGAAGALRDYLRSQGFTVSRPKVEGGSIRLGFERTDAPDQMDDVSIPIARRVRDLGGDYDGWGC